MTSKEKIIENGYDDVVIFENPGYDEALVGVSHDNRAVYDYEKMVESLMNEDNMTEEEAKDFISYNTERAIPYIGKDAPIILYPFLINE